MMLGPWLAVVAVLPFAATIAALLWRGRPWSTRGVPADLFRVATGVAFAAWVDPSLGLLAGLSAFWWVVLGWERVTGGTLWPVVAMAVWLGLQASEAQIGLLLAGLLLAGTAQVAVALLQRVRAPIFRAGQIHGTIGHRTGLGMYLAILTPLAFASGAGPWAAAVFGLGVALSASLVASVAWLVGLLIAAPSLWPLALGGALVGGATRLFKWRGGLRARHWRDSWGARRDVWQMILTRARLWPAWLIGYGAGAFALAGRRVTGQRQGSREIFREAHNDYLEFLFEYGLLGVLAVALWASRYAALSVGDPVSGGVGAFAVSMLAQFPLRVAPIAALALVLAILLMRRGPAWG